MPLETTVLVRRHWTWSAVAGLLLCAAVLLTALQVQDARADGAGDPAGVGVIGDSLTYQHGRGEAELATRLAGLGYQNVRVDGSTGRAMTTDQPTAPGSIRLIRRWRRAGFDPQTYVIALGLRRGFVGPASGQARQGKSRRERVSAQVTIRRCRCHARDAPGPVRGNGRGSGR